jgi:hypothetical protein
VPIGIVVLGLLLAVPAGVALVARSVRALDGAPSMSAPGVEQRNLSAGTWVVFERTGTRTGFGGVSVSRTGSPELQPADVTVTAPDGTSVQVGFVTTNQTITRGTAIYTGVLQFAVQSSGTYTIAVQGPAVQVIVSRSLAESLGGILPLFGVTALGGLLVLGGLVWLVVRAARGSRTPAYAVPGAAFTPGGAYTPGGAFPPGGAYTPGGAFPPGGAYTPGGAFPPGAGVAPGAALTPAGWYPDPSGQARLRWWDGARWTENSA